MVRAQILSELEEVMDYKQLPDDSPEQVHVRNKWMKRYVGLVVYSVTLLLICS